VLVARARRVRGRVPRAGWSELPALRRDARARTRRPAAAALARAAFEASCQLGVANDCAVLAQAIFEGIGGVADPRGAAKTARDACDKGSGLGCALAARWLAAGKGSPPDLAGALVWMQRGCELKHP